MPLFDRDSGDVTGSEWRARDVIKSPGGRESETSVSIKMFLIAIMNFPSFLQQPRKGLKTMTTCACWHRGQLKDIKAEKDVFFSFFFKSFYINFEGF